MQHRLILITGGSGVGKSSLARALQEALLPTPWLHFSADTLFYTLPPSVVARVDLHNDWSAVDSKALVASAHACVHTLLERGHPVVFDAVVVARSGEAALSAAFEAYRPLRVHLSCAWDEIQRRTLARGDRTIAEAWHGFQHALRPSSSHHHVETTQRSPEDIAAELAPQLCRGASSG